MTTIAGLFGAGDTIGGSAHKFSSGSYSEGRLAGKAAVAFVRDHPEAPRVAEAQVDAFRSTVFAPLDLGRRRSVVTAGTVNPEILQPDHALNRLDKIMDEYG